MTERETWGEPAGSCVSRTGHVRAEHFWPDGDPFKEAAPFDQICAWCDAWLDPNGDVVLFRPAVVAGAPKPEPEKPKKPKLEFVEGYRECPACRAIVPIMERDTVMSRCVACSHDFDRRSTVIDSVHGGEQNYRERRSLIRGEE